MAQTSALCICYDTSLQVRSVLSWLRPAGKPGDVIRLPSWLTNAARAKIEATRSLGLSYAEDIVPAVLPRCIAGEPRFCCGLS
jgi:hypothetical protein